MTKQIKLVLEDGAVFTGKSFGYEGSVAGEVVFNTAMVGYPESLTDPSYRGQILVMTYPLIGNYGVPSDVAENGLPRFYESDRIHIAGLVITDYSFEYSHWNAAKSLSEWLVEHKIPAVYAVDTRAITKRLRTEGTMLGKLVFEDQDLPFHDPLEENLVAQVSCPEIQVYGNGSLRIVLVDCGVKYNIIRCLLQFDTTVVRVPWDYDFNAEPMDGLFISNGPGDPALCDKTIAHLRTAFNKNIPIMGICLGNQLMGLAAGASTYKLKFGHRSHNQPAATTCAASAYITSQNHSFAIDTSTLPEDWEVHFENLNDGTNEGIRHKSKPFFSSQFHPEATSGPVDTAFLFGQFIEEVKKYKNQ